MRILVVKLHALGDVVIHTPAFEMLREGLPKAHITLLTTDWAAPASVGLPFFDEVISVSSRLFFKRSLESFTGLIKLFLDLRKRSFDCIVSFHRSRSINSFLRLLGAASHFYFYSDRDSKRSVKLDETRHSAPNACDLAGLAIFQLTGIKSNFDLSAIRYSWKVLPDELEKARSFLNSNGVKENYFALIFPGGGSNPRANAREKRWKADGYAELAEWLILEKGFDVLLAGSKDDSEVCNTVVQHSTCRLIDVSGKLDIRTMAALMSLSRLTITNDSAPLHISAAVGAPTIGIFGPTGIEHKLPPGGNSVGVKLGLPCSPCYYGVFKGCQFDNIRCMDELPVSTVLRAAEALMSRTGNRNE